MKKILSLMLLFATLITFAQHEGKSFKMRKDLTPEQKAILKTKKTALALDLNDSQLAQMLELNKKWAQSMSEKKQKFNAAEGEEMSSEEKFKRMEQMLDQQLAHQRQVAKILTKEQYKDWKDLKETQMRMLHRKRGDSHRKHKEHKEYKEYKKHK